MIGIEEEINMDFTGTGYQMPEEELLRTRSASGSCNTINCANCGASNYVSFKFCWQCGKEI